MTGYFAHLKKKLWIGTLSTHAVMLSVVWMQWPWLFKHMVAGVVLGVFYLWSLIYNAEHPRRKVQLVFSLIRMVLLAYIIVSISGGRLPEVTVVICGLLSYKVILTVEYVIQALPAFGWRRRPGRTVPQGESPQPVSEV